MRTKLLMISAPGSDTTVNGSMAQRSAKRIGIGVIGTAVCLLLAPFGAFAGDNSPQVAAGPTVDSVIAVEQEYARAYVNSDADALGRLLADDWQVINTHGGWGQEGIRKGVLDAVRSHQWIHTALDVSDIKVRLYGNTAIATEHVNTSGVLGGKTFEGIKEVETDVFVWSDGSWKCVLTHETGIQK